MKIKIAIKIKIKIAIKIKIEISIKIKIAIKIKIKNVTIPASPCSQRSFVKVYKQTGERPKRS